LDFGFENAVIWGPNGSGKSAVVDAIDFVLTGRIPRLVGEGTQGVTLVKHGPHVDSVRKPETAQVEVKISVPGINSPVTLARSVASPTEVHVDGAKAEELNDIMMLAERRQHSLSRREILKYIAAQAGKRSMEVQAILDLSPLEATRKALKAVTNQAKQKHSSQTTSVSDQETVLKTNLGLDEFSEVLVLGGINKLRALLKGSALERLDRSGLKTGLRRPQDVTKGGSVNPRILESTIKSVTDRAENEIKSVCSNDVDLRVQITKAKQDEAALKSHERLKLLELGIDLIDDSGECPLCGYEWETAELRDTIGSRISQAKQISPALDRISMLARDIKTEVHVLRLRFADFEKAANELKLSQQATELNELGQRLERFESACDSPIDNYADSEFTSAEFQNLFRSGSHSKLCEDVLNSAKQAAPEVSEEQTAWDTLTKLEATLPQYILAKSQFTAASILKNRAVALYDAFESARDEQLGLLYDSIKQRFAEFYKSLHVGDEDKFDATLKADGKFVVDFYGRGQHPPLALHSEGHQDSMGLCLYLALAERLTKGKCNLTVLDDVVMSVDAGHRREVCRLLKESFPDRQFLITTHDRTWAKQLQVEGVCNSTGSFEFTKWSIDDGPVVDTDADIWNKIKADLGKSDSNSAAARLRNGSERFFESVCDATWARVRYRADGRWELGDFMEAALGRYRDILKMSKSAAQSWGNKKEFEQLSELDSVRVQIVQRTNLEQWAVNSAVHYSKWHEFEPCDLKPIVEAFKDCFQLFLCTKCGAMIRVTEEKRQPTGVRCSCQHINWNLVSKPKK